LIEALKARGVTARTAQELVEAHPAGRVRTKIEVFDWLLKNEDRRVGKNPAGYLVASIRSDYQAPVDYQAQANGAKAAGEAKAAAEAKAEHDKARARDEARRDKAREERLRAAWERLPEAEREAIRAAVKVENPGIGRWKNMLEPLYLAALEARMGRDIGAGAEGGAQRLLFPGTRPAKVK
jgi:hypothetical protein